MFKYPITQLIMVMTIVSLAALMALFAGSMLPTTMMEEEGHLAKSNSPTPNRQQRRTGNIDQFNWLVSISWKRYSDVESSWEFFCPGTIIHTSKVLTGNGCLKEYFTKTDILRGFVRSGSSYIFKSGLTHNINEVQNNPTLNGPYRKIFILTVSPPFSDNTNKPILLGRTVGSRTHCEIKSGSQLISVSWGGFQIPSEQVEKNEPFLVEEWFPAALVPCIKNVCHQVQKLSGNCCIEAHLGVINQPIGPVSGKSLVVLRKSGPPILMGMHISHLYRPPNSYITERDLSFLLDLAEPEFLEWLRTEVPEAMYPIESNATTNLGEKYKLYTEVRTKDYLDDVEWFQKYNAMVKFHDFRGSGASGFGSGDGKEESNDKNEGEERISTESEKSDKKKRERSNRSRRSKRR